jgi:hypothetical protein
MLGRGHSMNIICGKYHLHQNVGQQTKQRGLTNEKLKTAIFYKLKDYHFSMGGISVDDLFLDH